MSRSRRPLPLSCAFVPRLVDGALISVAERILLGHFLTRREAASRAHITTREVATRPDLLRVGGTWLEEVYFAFQFSKRGVRQDVGRIVRDMRRRFDDDVIADWLARPNAHLDGFSPIRWLDTGRDADRVDKASYDAGPTP